MFGGGLTTAFRRRTCMEIQAKEVGKNVGLAAVEFTVGTRDD